MIKQVFKTMVAFLAVATMTIGPAWGQNSSTSSLVFESSCGGSGTANDGVQWTVTSDGAESNYDGTKGIHYGTNSAQVQYIQLSTSGIEGTITQVKVNASTASNVSATVGVTVGGSAFGGNAQSLTSSAANYTFTGSATGTIVVRVEKPSAATKALYVKSIEVTYTPASSGGGSTPEPPTPGQNATTYNVTFSGFSYPTLNTTVNVASLPQTFTSNFNPPSVINDVCYGFTGAYVTSGGEGEVSASVVTFTEMSITVSGTFEGTATIHVTGKDDEERDISTDVYVSCVAVAPAAPTPHTVRMAAGTEEAANWSIASGNASVPGTQVLGNVMSGSQVTATYNGTTKKVKSVKAVKYVAPAATVTTAPTATEGIIEAGSTADLVNAGAANGGTMMYAVTTTNVQPASTAFSATIPTAEGRAAGTYYVWFYAKADADHSDSEIAGPVSVTVAEATPALSLTSPSVGQVIGSDGKNYAAASVPSGVTKVAMIAYVSGSHGLAIALADEGSLNWETAKSTCEAKTPAFTGGTWKLPTQAEWNQMLSANGGSDESYTGLNTAINTAGGTTLQGGKGYWSSTPDGSKAYYVWLQDGDTDWRSLVVAVGRQVRACLAF